jgi:hypothetical protein
VTAPTPALAIALSTTKQVSDQLGEALPTNGQRRISALAAAHVNTALLPQQQSAAEISQRHEACSCQFCRRLPGPTLRPLVVHPLATAAPRLEPNPDVKGCLVLDKALQGCEYLRAFIAETLAVRCHGMQGR